MSDGTDQMMIMRHHALKELVDTEVRYGEKLVKLYDAYPLHLTIVLSEYTVYLTHEQHNLELQNKREFTYVSTAPAEKSLKSITRIESW
eukprot:COSAG05_NODE_1992_length_3734_cov_2.706740_5_plen_89_part_00